MIARLLLILFITGLLAKKQINIYQDADQVNPVVSILADGGFIVVWQIYDQVNGQYGIFGQRYHSNHSLYGSEFRVKNYTTDNQWYPSISSLADGGFIVVWQSYGQDGDGYGIYGRRYQANNSPYGSEFRVNSYTTSDQQHPSVSSLADGGYIVVWTSSGQDSSGDGIFGQRYHANQSLYGPEFRVNSNTANYRQQPSVSSLADGGFIVVWQSYEQGGDGYGIYGQRYGPNHSPYGFEFQVNSNTSTIQEYSSVSSLADGGYIIVWQINEEDGDGYEIYGQQYHANNSQSGSEFRVNTYTASDQLHPSVSSLADGGFVVVWQSFEQDGDGYGIYGQRYHANNSQSGPEFLVNSHTINNQQQPSVSSFTDGGFVVVWQSNGQDGNGFEIFAEIYSQCLNQQYYLFNNNSCISECPFYYAINSLRRTCTYPCADPSDYYFSHNSSCLLFCPSPFIPMTVGHVSYCKSPCSEPNNYFYQNNTCLSGCSYPPFQVQIFNSIQYCNYIFAQFQLKYRNLTAFENLNLNLDENSFYPNDDQSLASYEWSCYNASSQSCYDSTGRDIFLNPKAANSISFSKSSLIAGQSLQTNITQKLFNATFGITILQINIISMQLLSNLDDLMSSTTSSNEEKVTLLSQLSSALSSIETDLSSTINQIPCPDCSSQGNCSIVPDTCTCSLGWSLSDCSMNEGKYSEIINSKEKITQNIQSLLNANTTDKVGALSAINDIAQNPEFVNLNIATTIQNILSSNLNLEKPGQANLTQEEVELASSIIDQLIKYSNYLCNGTFSTNLKNSTVNYLQSLSASMTSNQASNSNINAPNTFQGTNYDIYTVIVPQCEIANLNLTNSWQSPILALKWSNSDDTQMQNCSKLVEIEYYTMKPNMFECKNGSSISASNPKSSFAIKVSDAETKEDLTSKFSLQSTMPLGADCNKNCIETGIRNGQKVCECNDLSLFDVAGQFTNIFANSRFGKVGNINALLNWEFYKDPSFYVIIILTLWYLSTSLVFKKYQTIRKYNYIKTIKRNLSCAKQFWSAVLVSQNLLVSQF